MQTPPKPPKPIKPPKPATTSTVADNKVLAPPVPQCTEITPVAPPKPAKSIPSQHFSVNSVGKQTTENPIKSSGALIRCQSEAIISRSSQSSVNTVEYSIGGRALSTSPPPQQQQQLLSFRFSKKSDGTISTGAGSHNSSSSSRGSLMSMISISKESVFGSSSFASDDPMLYNLNVIKFGELMKMNRDGKFERNKFVLTRNKLIYAKSTPIATDTTDTLTTTATTTTTDITEEDAAVGAATDTTSSSGSVTSSKGNAATASAVAAAQKELNLDTVLAMDLDAADHRVLIKEEKWPRTFKILSQQKSFFVRAPDEDSKREWCEEIQLAARQLQMNERGSVVKEEELAPIWSTHHANCQLCMKKFSFFARKHHCRNCGRCVCEGCSREMVRIPKIDEWKLFKVCNPCARDIKETRFYGADSRRGVTSPTT